MTSGAEPIEEFSHLLGPDTDKNWSFEGLIYLSSYLRYKCLQYRQTDRKEKIQSLTIARANVSRLHDYGRASHSRPALLVEFSRSLFDKLTKAQKQLEEEIKAEGDGQAGID